jgi:hypothetical protein
MTIKTTTTELLSSCHFALMVRSKQGDESYNLCTVCGWDASPVEVATDPLEVLTEDEADSSRYVGDAPEMSNE